MGKSATVRTDQHTTGKSIRPFSKKLGNRLIDLTMIDCPDSAEFEHIVTHLKQYWSTHYLNPT
jgi:hypothetical protein